MLHPPHQDDLYFLLPLLRALFIPFDFARTEETWQFTRTTTGELMPELDRLGSVVADPFPSKVERDAEHENDQQRDH
jgi:hypothetical protein